MLKIFENIRFPLQDLQNLSEASPIICNLLEQKNLLVDVETFCYGFTEEVTREFLDKEAMNVYGLRYSEEKSWVQLFKNIKMFANEEEVDLFFENMV